MDSDVNKLYKDISELLYNELKGAKSLNGEQIKRFKDYFLLDEEELGLFYTEYNLIITEPNTLDGMRSFIDLSKTPLSLDIREFSACLVIYPYFNDGLIASAIGY